MSGVIGSRVATAHTTSAATIAASDSAKTTQPTRAEGLISGPPSMNGSPGVVTSAGGMRLAPSPATDDLADRRRQGTPDGPHRRAVADVAPISPLALAIDT